MLLSHSSFSNSSGLLFNVSISGMTLSLKPKTNYTYPDVGLLITSPNYSFSKPATQCTGWPKTNGYCTFSAGPSTPALITIKGAAGVLKFKLCLNSWGKISCQNYSIDISQQDQCNASGGKIVSGSKACWIEVPVTNPAALLRCSSKCNALGMSLQNPGPVNSSNLAENVCTAFGYTDTAAIGPINATFIGNAFTTTACYWNDFTGTNWDNPNNSNYPVVGSYFCPCT